VRQYELFRREWEENALLGVRLIEALAEDLTPDRLDKAQAAIRHGLLDAESRVRAWRGRTRRREALIKALRVRSGGGPVVGDHLRLCATYEDSLVQYRQMFRQLGDAVAWILLRNDPRVIAPLYSLRTHFLNLGVGIVGPTQVITQAHASEQFLVLDNDLTRCVGVGDITVFPAERSNHCLPISLELKTTSQDADISEGAEVTINASGAISSEVRQQELHKRFIEILGMSEGTSARTNARDNSKQETEMKSKVELLFKLTNMQRGILDPPTKHWNSLRNVLDRATQCGSAYDIPERGVAILAVRNHVGENSLGMLRHTLVRLQGDGFPKGEPHISLTDFQKDDRLSPFFPPVALWPIPSNQRAALLSGRLFLGGVFTSTVWTNALGQEGLSLSAQENGWVITGGVEEIRLDVIEVNKLRIGVAFGGVSPRSVARVLRLSIAGGNRVA
jgi:hypothetical protein